MTAETPEIGLVFRHIYLWRDEQKQGKEEGRKARPCLIVHKRPNEYLETEVLICPITHTQPLNLELAKEIPQSTKQRLNLDSDRSWIITTEVNRFTWKGPDVSQAPSGNFVYGYLPSGLTRAAIDQVRENAKRKNLGIVNRDDEELNKQVRKYRQRTQAKRREDNDRDR